MHIETIDLRSSHALRGWQTRRTLDIPHKPDPDVLRLSRTFDLAYGKAKMLKALSYGIHVDEAFLIWCSGNRISHNTLRNYVYKIRRATGFAITCDTKRGYVIHSEEALNAIRKAMA